MSQVDQVKIDTLKQEFESFSREIARLEAAHQLLEQRYRMVNVQLEEKILQLNATSEYLRRLISGMGEGVIFVSKSGQITTFNQAAADILGLDARDCLHQRFASVFSDTDFGFFMRDALRDLEAPTFSVASFRRHDGKQVEIEVSITLSSSAGHEGLLLLLRDVTETRQLQATAARRDRLTELGQLAATMAHEIRNPLGGIKGFASLLERDLEAQPDLKRMATYIIEGVGALDRLVNQILGYSRAVHPCCSTTTLLPLLEEVKQLVLLNESLNRDLQIEVRSDPHLSACIDRQLIKAALLNLAVNAAQASAAGGKIRLTADREGSEILVSVIDEGAGISLEQQKKIFSPFFTTKTQGNGLGLAEALKTVEAHGGSIQCRSEIGKGSTFTIRLRQEFQ